MDEAVEFARRYVAKSWEIEKGYYAERDPAKWKRMLAEFDAMLDLPGGSGKERPASVSDEWRREGMESHEELLPPILFQVKQYEHPKLGTLYRFYVSSWVHQRHTLFSYFWSVYAQPKKGGLKVVAIDFICADCRGRGCAKCKGRGWTHQQGVDVGNPGKQVDVRKLRAPTRAEDKADYDSPQGLDAAPAKISKKR